MLEVGDDGRPALGEHAQQRRRGLAGGGVAEVDDDVGRLDVGGELAERHAAGHDRRARARRAARGARRGGAGSGTGPDEQEAEPRVAHGRPRHRAGHGLDPLLRREQAEDADHDVVRARSRGAPGARGHARRVDRRRPRPASGTRTTSAPGHLRADRLGHEGVVDGDRARGLDGDAEERVGVGQQVAHGAEVGLEEPVAAARVASTRARLRHASSEGRAAARAAALDGSRRQASTASDSRNCAARAWCSTRSWSTSRPGTRDEQLVDEVVGPPVAHLVDREVVGALAVARHELGGGEERRARGKPRGVDRLLRVEERRSRGGRRGARARRRRSRRCRWGPAGGARRRRGARPSAPREERVLERAVEQGVQPLHVLVEGGGGGLAAGRPCGTGWSCASGSTGDRISTRTSVKPAAAARKRRVSGCSGRSWVRSRLKTSRKPVTERGFTVSSSSRPPGRSARWASASRAGEDRRRQVLGHLRREDPAERARGLRRGGSPRGRPRRRRARVSRHSRTTFALPSTPRAAMPALAQDLQELAAPAAEVHDGGEACEAAGVAREALADLLAAAAEAVLEGGVGRVGGGARGRGGDRRRRGAGGERAADRPHLLGHGLQPVAQREEALEPPAQRLEAPVEGLEEQLGARGGEGGGHAVARVHDRLHALRVAHERAGELAQARVQVVGLARGSAFRSWTRAALKAACRSMAGATASQARRRRAPPRPPPAGRAGAGQSSFSRVEPLADLRGGLRGQRERGRAGRSPPGPRRTPPPPRRARARRASRAGCSGSLAKGASAATPAGPRARPGRRARSRRARGPRRRAPRRGRELAALHLEDHRLVLLLHELADRRLVVGVADELGVGQPARGEDLAALVDQRLDQRVDLALVLGLDVVDEAPELDVRVEPRDHGEIVA